MSRQDGTSNEVVLAATVKHSLRSFGLNVGILSAEGQFLAHEVPLAAPRVGGNGYDVRMVGLNGRGVGEVSLAIGLASEVHEPEFLVGIVGGMIPVNGLIACGYALHVEGQHECRPMRCCLVASGLEGALETDVLSGEVDGRIELHRIGHHDVLGRIAQDDVLSGERLGHAGTSLEQIERVYVAAIADEVGLVGVAGIDEYCALRHRK